MNLRAIANRAIQTVNPDIPAILKTGGRYETDETGRRTAVFDETEVVIQTQSLSAQERQEFDGLLQQGQMLNVYITGQLHVLSRIKSEGAQKLVFAPYGEEEMTEWLVKSIPESWPDWCKVVVWRQK